VKFPANDRRASPTMTPGTSKSTITFRLLLFSAVVNTAAPRPLLAR
jgi:hypothetical protein